MTQQNKQPSPAGEGAQETLGQACCRPAPDRSGRSCDKPKGHGGEHWSYGGGGISWQADVAPSLPPERAALVGRMKQADPKWQERSEEELRSVISTLCHFIWHRQLRPGEHLWSIPVDHQRDFDIILSDAVDELIAWRAAAAALRGETGEK